MDLIEDTSLNTNTRKAIVECREDVRYFQDQMHYMLEALDRHHDKMRGWNLNATRRILHTLEIAKECMDAYGDFIGASDTGIDADIDIRSQIETRTESLGPLDNPHYYPRSFYDREVADRRVRGENEYEIVRDYEQGIADTKDKWEAHMQVHDGCTMPPWLCEIYN